MQADAVRRAHDVIAGGMMSTAALPAEIAFIVDHTEGDTIDDLPHAMAYAGQWAD